MASPIRFAKRPRSRFTPGHSVPTVSPLSRRASSSTVSVLRLKLATPTILQENETLTVSKHLEKDQRQFPTFLLLTSLKIFQAEALHPLTSNEQAVKLRYSNSAILYSSWITVPTIHPGTKEILHAKTECLDPIIIPASSQRKDYKSKRRRVGVKKHPSVLHRFASKK